MGLFRKKRLDFDMVTTKGGDSGKSSLYSGEFVRKNDIVFDLIGEIDELTSVLGITRRELGRHHVYVKSIDKVLYRIQNELYVMMSVIATSSDHEYYIEPTNKNISISKMESDMHNLMGLVEIEPKFVIPTTYFDVARTVARRVERRFIDYIENKQKTLTVEYQDLYHCNKYLNRLSDFLFVCARYLDHVSWRESESVENELVSEKNTKTTEL